MKTTLRKMFWALLSLIALPVSAYDFEVDEIYYDITSLSEFTCAVTTGEVPYEGTFVIPAIVEYNNRTLTVTGINDMGVNTVRSLTIPNTVLSVAIDAFYNCSNLDSLIIQDGDTEIDLGRSNHYVIDNPNIYRYNGPLTNTPTSYVYIGRNIKTIRFSQGYAYYYYDQFYKSNIKVAEIGDNVTSNPYFAESEKLEKVTIGKGVTIISGFYGCVMLSDVLMSDNVLEIGESAFGSCDSLRTISLSPNIEKIGRNAFSRCGLQSISLPKSVKEVGVLCFERCKDLSSVELSDAITDLSESTFEGCTNLRSVKLSQSLTNIGESAFRDCSSLTKIELPQSVVTIRNNAFQNSGLVEIAIPNLVEYLGSWNKGTRAFAGCNLKSITLGESLQRIESDVFNKFDSLEVINVLAITPPQWDNPKFTTNQYMTMPVNVPIGTKEAYMQANVWKNFWNINEVLPNSIGTVSTDSQEDTNAIYTINGVKHNTTNLSDLPSGIYIKNGKKVYVK